MTLLVALYLPWFARKRRTNGRRWKGRNNHEGEERKKEKAEIEGERQRDVKKERVRGVLPAALLKRTDVCLDASKEELSLETRKRRRDEKEDRLSPTSGCMYTSDSYSGTLLFTAF